MVGEWLGVNSEAGRIGTAPADTDQNIFQNSHALLLFRFTRPSIELKRRHVNDKSADYRAAQWDRILT